MWRYVALYTESRGVLMQVVLVYNGAGRRLCGGCIRHGRGGRLQVYGSDVLSHALVCTCDARAVQLSIGCSQVCVMSLGATQSRWAGCSMHGSGY